MAVIKATAIIPLRQVSKDTHHSKAMDNSTNLRGISDIGAEEFTRVGLGSGGKSQCKVSSTFSLHMSDE